MEKVRANLYRYRNVALFAKGHYSYSTPKAGIAGLARMVAADAPGEKVDDVLMRVACDALLQSDDAQAELKSHVNYIMSRFRVLSEEQEVTPEIFSSLMNEALLAIIARWKLPEDIELGQPDGNIWSLSSPKKG